MRRAYLAPQHLLSLVLVSLLLGCNGPAGAQTRTIGPSLTVMRTDWGMAWPFTIDRGELRCIGRGETAELYFVTPDLTIYAMNAPAIAAGTQPAIQTAPFSTSTPITPLLDRGGTFVAKANGWTGRGGQGRSAAVAPQADVSGRAQPLSAFEVAGCGAYFIVRHSYTLYEPQLLGHQPSG